MKIIYAVGAVVLFGSIGGVPHVRAGDNTAVPVETLKCRSANEILTHDARFDLKAAQRSDFEGHSISKGWACSLIRAHVRRDHSSVAF